MSLIERITEDMRSAQKSGQADRLMVLRMMLSQVHNRKIELGHEPADPDTEQVLQKELKKRKEAALLYEQGGRKDLALKESSEAELIGKYLPAPRGQAELERAVEEAVASGEREFGKVMRLAMQKLGAGVDGKDLSEIVKRKLAG